ncbi:sensor histidine kinase [Histidinibacterium lentulum]|uniref:sensor histidine kinase n=1 Tax=Histidinibacterium lentulum TaxID=2480588 RepID=UPI001609EB83|nr:sensor histidine kinase [Histidinibacterium lentulum]
MARRRMWASLSLRLAVMLSLALVPLGLIAISQTTELRERYDRVSELNLRVSAEALARQEGMAIETALGAAEALASTYLPLAAPAAVCSDALRRLKGRLGQRVVFIGFIPVDGMMTCGTDGAPHDFSTFPGFDAHMTRRTLFVTSTEESRISRTRVITVHSPIWTETEEFRGYASVALATEDLIEGCCPDATVAEPILDYVLLDRNGALLDASREMAAVDAILPGEEERAEVLARPPEETFVARTASGETRRFSVAEVVPMQVFLVGSVPIGLPTRLDQLMPPNIYPVLMWLISLALVFAVVEGSLVAPVRAMADRMREFGDTRELRPPSATVAAMPLELRRIETAFAETAARLVQEEAQLADTLHDKEVLLKEVHHRVKNNLQMVSSILNMQMREAGDPAIETVLGKAAGRIASLAAVHRQVYSADRTGAVGADELLREIVLPLSQTLMSDWPAGERPGLRLDLAPIRLTPDQAMPAAMFVVEALPYLLAEAQPDADGARWVLVRATDSPPVWEGDMADVWIEVRRSGPARSEADEASGLGLRLIRGFARQLQGEVHEGRTEHGHGLALRFRAMPFSDAPPEIGV